MIVTWEEALAESRAEGESQGRAEGRSEGEALAKPADLLLVARHRFGDLAAGFEDEIRGISDLDQLNDLFEQALKVESLLDLDHK